jgi:hypothetical protein
MVDDRSLEIIKNQLISILLVSEFYQYIKRKNIVDRPHFRKKAEKCIAMEDACVVKKEDLNAATGPSQARNQGKPPKPPKTDHKYDREGKEPRYKERYNNYTALNARRDKSFKEINNMDIIGLLPLPIPSHPRLDCSKRCKYHRSYGHTTAEYRHLKDKKE